MYWHRSDDDWVAAMHVDWYSWTRDDCSDMDVVLKYNKSRMVALCGNVVPVKLPGSTQWGVPCAITDSMIIPEEVHRFVRRLNLLRYQFRSQKY